jgi:hypothetical protein
MLLSLSSQLSDAYAQAVSSKYLIENAKSLDGKTMRYKGEAVTAVLNRGEYSWVNLNDGDNAIGVWCRSSSLSSVRFVGDYRNKGDKLEVEGVFHRACPEHKGELDIHAANVKIAETGFRIYESVDIGRLYISFAVFLSIILLVIIFRKRV